MYEGQRRMAGRFITVPVEVVIELEKLTAGAERMYFSLLAHHAITENWDTPGEWVEGTLETSKIEMVRRAGISRGWFYKQGTGWQSLIDAGLVLDIQGKIRLPKLKKKSDAFMSPAEIRNLRADMDQIKSIIFDKTGKKIDLFTVGLSQKAEQIDRALSAHNRAPSARNRALSEQINKPTSISGFKEIDIEEEEDPTHACIRSKEIATVENGVENIVEKSGQNPVGSADWIRDLIINLWPTRGYREEDEDFVAKFAGGDPEKILEAFAAAKKQRNVRRLSWIANRLEDPEVYKGAGDDGRKNLRSGGTTQGQGSRRRSTGSDKAGAGRVDREEWPDVT